nr:sulfatase-like hydrolase/transferase [Akkermansiaceae bacterium]
SEGGLYGDVIEEIDWSVGEILATLKKLGIDEDTLIVYTSDNGPWLSVAERGGSALPLRGGKFTTYEGGVREPTLMRWPGRIPAGTVCSEVAATIDLLPTFARLAGGKVPADRVIDGRDIWPLIAGEEGAKSPHQAFFYYRGDQLEAVRAGRWKYRSGGLDRASRKAGRKGRETALFDLHADKEESTNLIDKHPEVAERLKGLIADFDAERKANSRPAGKTAPSR